MYEALCVSLFELACLITKKPQGKEMKIALTIAIISACFISGCASTVTTFDATGKVSGSCTAQNGFILGGGATCSGRANGEASK